MNAHVVRGQPTDAASIVTPVVNGEILALLIEYTMFAKGFVLQFGPDFAPALKLGSAIEASVFRAVKAVGIEAAQCHHDVRMSVAMIAGAVGIMHRPICGQAVRYQLLAHKLLKEIELRIEAQLMRQAKHELACELSIFALLERLQLVPKTLSTPRPIRRGVRQEDSARLNAFAR